MTPPPPGADPQAPWIPHPHGLRHAAELIELIHSLGTFSVGVAAFPETHPRSPDLDTDVDRFVAKCRNGADFAITQMFFRAEDYLQLRDRVGARGCDIPILAGVMPVTNAAQITRIVQLSGQAFPDRLATRFAELDGPRPEDRAAVADYGVQVATELCQTLLDHGVPGLHFITMNRSTASREVIGNLGGRLLVGARSAIPPRTPNRAEGASGYPRCLNNTVASNLKGIDLVGPRMWQRINRWGSS